MIHENQARALVPTPADIVRGMAASNAAQHLYFPWLAAKIANPDPRGGTPPKKRRGKVRGPKGFDLALIKNPEKHLHSHARAMVALKAAISTPPKKARAKKVAA